MTDLATKQRTLAPSDQERMQRRSEEIRGRLHEMALIMGRTLEMNFESGTTLRFAPTRSTRNAAATDVEIVCSPDGCGCWVMFDDGTGLCEFPCGSAG
ncbi:hypothetical protein [Kitasatospora sp. NPDC050463]|uniref:hypothetical protein n=1 Tax=Kitasatospora sp. NPDC050463 TaxID=3155786 RepID=UPI0033D17701